MIRRGEKMRKDIALLLIVGFLLGTFGVIGGMSEISCEEPADFSGGELPEDNFGGPAPCGGGGESGGSGGTPG